MRRASIECGGPPTAERPNAPVSRDERPWHRGAAPGGSPPRRWLGLRRPGAEVHASTRASGRRLDAQSCGNRSRRTIHAESKRRDPHPSVGPRHYHHHDEFRARHQLHGHFTATGLDGRGASGPSSSGQEQGREMKVASAVLHRVKHRREPPTCSKWRDAWAIENGSRTLGAEVEWLRVTRIHLNHDAILTDGCLGSTDSRAGAAPLHSSATSGVSAPTRPRAAGVLRARLVGLRRGCAHRARRRRVRGGSQR
jgi:hypothetical protein